MNNDERFMGEAVKEAQKGFREGEVPIGAVAVRNGEIVARGHNKRFATSDITAHAEMVCLRDLSSRDFDFDLSDITIYSTLEPCAMCLGAMTHYEVGNVVFGEYDLMAGACGSKYNYFTDLNLNVIGGIYKTACRNIMLEFFEKKLGRKSTVWEDIELPAE